MQENSGKWRDDWRLCAGNGVFRLNKKQHVVGIGPGAYEQMTIRAAKVLESCDVIIGYTVYVDLVQNNIFREKRFRQCL